MYKMMTGNNKDYLIRTLFKTALRVRNLATCMRSSYTFRDVLFTNYTLPYLFFFF